MLRSAAPFAIAALLSLCACTTVEVSPVPRQGYPIEAICIERNPDVVVEDFVQVLEQGFARHGIASRVVAAPLPADCDYTLWYSARRRWDFRPVLGYAELRVRYRGETIGTATWVARPSLSPFKWRSTESKIGPVLDELLAQFPAPDQALRLRLPSATARTTASEVASNASASCEKAGTSCSRGPEIR